MSLGASFALVRIFGTPQTISLAFAPKILTNTKPPPQLLRWLLRAIALANPADCDLQRKSATNQTQNVESTLDSTIPQNLAQSAQKFLLLLAFAKSRVLSL